MARSAHALALALLVAACGQPAAPEAEADAAATEPATTGVATGEVPLDELGLPAGLAPFLDEDRLGWPVERVHVTSEFGWRVDPVSGAGTSLHKGIDLRGKRGDLVMSVADGTVAFVGVDPYLGNLVIIDHGRGIESLYGHLDDVLVHGGLPVGRGTAIGLVGNTGRSAAPHLHFTMKISGQAIDPLLLLRAPLHDVPAMAGDPGQIPGREQVAPPPGEATGTTGTPPG